MRSVHDDPAADVSVRRQVHSDGIPLYQSGYIFQDDEIPLLSKLLQELVVFHGHRRLHVFTQPTFGW